MKRIASIIVGLFLLLSPSLAAATVWTMPTLPAVGPTNQTYTSQGFISPGGEAVTGSVKISPIGTPAAPTLSTNGTAGATSIVYACSGVDLNGVATIPSSTATITTANATLTTTNSVNITCGGKVGALAYLIHKVDTAHVLGICYATSGGSCTLIDDGSVATTFTYTAPTTDQTGAIVGANAAVQKIILASPIVMCSTSGVAGNACAEPTYTLVPGYPDTNYSISCTCVSPTGAAVIRDVIKASNAIQPEVMGVIGATATCAEVDCLASHQ